MNKAHPFASALYIGTGFAHINRVANVARFIWVNMKIQPVVEGQNFNKLKASSLTMNRDNIGLRLINRKKKYEYK